VRAWLSATAVAVACFLFMGCTDDGSGVRGTGSASGSGRTSDSASGSRPATGRPALGGYVPAGDLGGVANISRDACDIADALAPSPPDFATAATVYADGRHAFEPDGTRLSLRGFATAGPRRPLMQQYARHFADPAWLDAEVGGALAGTGPFAGQPAAVRRQAVLTGVQVAVPVAWALDELDIAQERLGGPGGTDPDRGAPHHVDRAWVFYRGDALRCAPFLVASEAGRQAGTGTALPDAIRERMRAAVESAVSGDGARLTDAATEVRRLLVAVHAQAVLGSANRMDGAAAAGDQSEATVRRTEARALFRSVEPLVAGADPGAAARVASLLGPGAASRGRATAPDLRDTLEPALAGLGIITTEIWPPIPGGPTEKGARHEASREPAAAGSGRVWPRPGAGVGNRLQQG
jgi:hypothetical protein